MKRKNIIYIVCVCLLLAVCIALAVSIEPAKEKDTEPPVLPPLREDLPSAPTTPDQPQTPENRVVSGSVIWNDEDNRDGKRPASVTLRLYKDGQEYRVITLHAETGWQYTFEDLPAYENGEPVVYSVAEDAIEGYAATYDGFRVTNSYTPGVTSVSGSVIWNDNDNRDGKRPASVTVRLHKDGQEYLLITLIAQTGWQYNFQDLPVYENGKQIVYSVSLDAIEGYVTTYDGFQVTNSYKPGETSVSGGVTWSDENNRDGKRPAKVTIRLYKDGQEYRSITLTAETGWRYTFEALSAYENGKQIVYSVREDAIEEYVITYNGFQVTNSYKPGKTSVSGSVTWSDGSNQDGKRPDSVTVHLWADGKKVASKKVTATNGWVFNFAELDRFANGKQITYTVTQDGVSGYTTAVEGFRVSNSYTPQQTQITVQKTWNDGNNQDGKRPKSVTVRLYKNGKEYKKATLTSSGGWKYTFEKLPVYENGKQIVYSITQDAVSGYTLTINGFQLVGTYQPKKTAVAGTVNWSDSNNKDGKRPASVTVHLMADNKKVSSKTVTAADGWKYRFAELDEYAAGKKITYKIQMDAVDGYTLAYNGFDVSASYVVQNSGGGDTSTPAYSVVLRPEASGVKVKSNDRATIDYSNASDGYVMVKYTVQTTLKLRVQVIGPSSTTYTYIIEAGRWEVLPLSDGNGTYQIRVLQNVEGNRYAVVTTLSTAVTLKDEFAPFLRPNQYVNYENATNTVKKGAELCRGKTGVLEKIGAIYQYVTKTLSYDYDKAATVQSGYLPDLDAVLAAKKGICFDYAALMTAMLRSQGIPCKLVIGYAGTQYHAWISVWSEETGWVNGAVYFDGTSWKRMDPTYMSTSGGSQAMVNYINNDANYTVKYLY